MAFAQYDFTFFMTSQFTLALTIHVSPMAVWTADTAIDIRACLL
eukprot:CAMPEP_0174969908 /NCGR_PEP_ID=MMETSP0004_2-20121128/9045_1 /TAXON_ID=420556 /ORGANISM="Ochromonas sp., Strain CCMP1393" /LENGTH=43 /DNA_ID= /DNA_START= /DNA_END= /DNA_ORIENTATION=